MSTQRNDRNFRATRIGENGLREHVAVHFRHVDVSHDRIETCALVEHREHFAGRRCSRHLITRCRYDRSEHVAEELAVIDDKHVEAPCMAARECVGTRQAHEMRDVENFGDHALNDGRAEEARILVGNLDVEPILDDVDDLTDEQAHRLAADADDKHGPSIRWVATRQAAEIDERHEASLVPHHRQTEGVQRRSMFELFDSRDQRQRNCLLRSIAGAEDDEMHRLFLRREGHRIARDIVFVRVLDADALRHARRIEDEHDGTIAEDRVAGKDGQLRQGGSQRLDDDFLDIRHRIDDEAKVHRSDAHDDDEWLHARGQRLWVEPQQLAQICDRQHVVAQLQDERALDILDARRFAGDADGFHHRMLRHGKPMPARLDDQRRRNGERQWDLEVEDRPAAPCGRQTDGTANRLDVFAHHIHADAAARDIGDRRCRRKARRKDEAADRLVGHVLEFDLGGEAVGEGLASNGIDVETAPVI